MKRFMLISLMSCMLVGQVSCKWSWSDYGKGLANASASAAIGSGFGAICGGAAAAMLGGVMCDNKKELFSAVRYIAILGAWCGGVYTSRDAAADALRKRFAYSKNKESSPRISKSEVGGNLVQYGVFNALPFVAAGAYGLYKAYQLPAQ